MVRAAAWSAQAVTKFEGGEAAGLERLRHYVWESNAVGHYADTRNGATTHLSAGFQRLSR